MKNKIMRRNIITIILIILFSSTVCAQDWKTQPGYNKFTYEGKDLWTKNQGEDIQFLLGTYFSCLKDEYNFEKDGYLRLAEGGSGTWYWTENYQLLPGEKRGNKIKNWGFVVDENGVLNNFEEPFKHEDYEQFGVYHLYLEVEHIPFGDGNNNWEYIDISHSKRNDREYLIIPVLLWVKDL